MMKPLIPALFLSILSACGTSPGGGVQPTPERAYLYVNSVNVVMSGGDLCVGHRPGRALDWTGRLSGCTSEYAYRVQLAANPQRPRQVLQKIPTADGATAPVLTVTDGRGRQFPFGHR